MYTGIQRCSVCGNLGVVLEDDNAEKFCRNHVTWSDINKDKLIDELLRELIKAIEERRRLEKEVKEGLDFTYDEDTKLTEILLEVNTWF